MQVLVKTAAAGVNPVDVIVAQRIYAPDKYPKASKHLEGQWRQAAAVV